MANLTLSIDDDLLKQARLYAVQNDTSVNAMVRDYLAGLVNQVSDERRGRRLQAIENIKRMAELIEQDHLIQGDWKWKREDAYADRFEKWDTK